MESAARETMSSIVPGTPGALMKIVLIVLITILALLALASGVTKIMLLPRDVEFFGAYGFTNLTLIIFGIAQVAGGILLIAPKTRVYGAVLVGITFLVSAYLLVLAGDIPAAVITVTAIAGLGVVAIKTR
jgi:uncharacterized membrane protein YphA (DoxX/SURF4 family)